MDHLELVRQFVTTNFYVPETLTLADDTSLLDEGIVDSTGMLEVTAFLEEQFGIRVEDAEMLPENLETICRITAFVASKRAALPMSA